MPRIDPWAALYERPAPRTKVVELQNPDWSLTIREPSGADLDTIAEMTADLVAKHIDGAPGEPPLKLLAPGYAPEVSRRFFGFAAAAMVLVVPGLKDDGGKEEPVSLLEVVGWRDKLPRPHWQKIQTELALISLPEPPTADGPADTETDPGNASGAGSTATA